MELRRERTADFMDDFDLDKDDMLDEEILGDGSQNQEDPGNLCFEEYRECYGDPSEVMKRHLLCTLCGGHLHFNHLLDFQNGFMQETARCPDCGVRIRQRLHKLQ